MIIDYERYLNATVWPSESGRPLVSAETGEVVPELKDVYDMPPQYAAAALHKLMRWARDGQVDDMRAEQEVRRVRSTVLGRALIAKATSSEDFALGEAHDVDREPLSNVHIAKALAKELMDIVELDANDTARLATELALNLSNHGYQIFKES